VPVVVLVEDTCEDEKEESSTVDAAVAKLSVEEAVQQLLLLMLVTVASVMATAGLDRFKMDTSVMVAVS
jgi:hypothetical protein